MTGPPNNANDIANAEIEADKAVNVGYSCATRINAPNASAVSFIGFANPDIALPNPVFI